MGGVFVSYRVREGGQVARSLQDVLARAFGPGEVFYAPRGIGAGDFFDTEILSAVRSSDVLVAVIGPHWLSVAGPGGTRRLDADGDWVRREIAEAFAHGVRVIPVLFDDAPMPAADDLPEEIHDLARCNALRLGHHVNDPDFDIIVVAIRAVVPRLAGLDADRTRPTPMARVPRQLPASTAAFTGRKAHLDELVTIARMVPERGGTVVIFAIDGMAGVGKTALAIHAGHRIGDRFPDGTLYVELNGYALDTPPRDPADALASVLISLGAPPQSIPDDLSGRAAAYRDRLAGKRMLIVLDDAATEQQVRPLLPGSPGCLVLVTGRRRLSTLDDAHALALDVLPMPEAVALLRATATVQRAPAGDPLLAEVAQLCGRLPLALRIAGAMLRTGRAHTPAHLADLLRTTHVGQEDLIDLSGFHDGGRNLAAVIARSYQTLDHEQQLLYRRLGLIPGPDVDSYAAAALLDTDPSTAGRLLGDLVDHNLLTQPAPGRYQMHNLIRAHAHTLTDPDPSDAFLDRLLNYDQYTANTADALISNMPRHPPGGPVPACAPTLPDPETAWTWLRAERSNLLAALHQATASGRHPHILTLTAGLATLLRIDGPWTLAIALHTTAATTAHHQGDHNAQAAALTHRGWIPTLAGDYPEAINDLQQAHGLYQDTGDRLGQANALTELAQTRRLTGDFPGAMRDLLEALGLCRELGDRIGQANALTNLGRTRRGDFPGAMRDLREALGLYRELGIRIGQANALIYMGRTRTQMGDVPRAMRDLQEAVRLCRELGNAIGQGNALTWLGHARLAAGDSVGAVRDLRQALELYREIGALANEAFALPHYAAALAATGDHTRALNLYHQALTLTHQLNQPYDEAFALEGIGECHVHLGDTTAGVEHLIQALAIFDRLGMKADARRVQARLTELIQP